MKRVILTIFAILMVLSSYAGNVITYKASSKLTETTDFFSSGLRKNAFNVSITSHTFSNGTGTINFSGEVTSIGYKAFSGCSGLTSITIPNSVTSIGEYAFYGCSGLTSITIPNSVTSIGEYAFYGCSGLTSITIPNSVTSIGNFAFSYCSGLTSMIVEANNSVYDSRNNCNAIIESATNTLIAGCKNTIIPNSVTSIGDYAFSGCSALTSVSIPNSVTSIGVDAFGGCTSLPVIDNIRYADTYLVEAVDKSITSCTIKSGTKWIGSEAFYCCSGLTSVTIPNSVTGIYCNAFFRCSSLTSITIPNSVTSIGYYAFYYCSGLTSITIPNSVRSIEEGAFWGCSGLTSITCEAIVPPTCGNWVFDYVDKSIPLYVPQGSISAYKAASGWKDFTNYQIITGVEEVLHRTSDKDSKIMVDGKILFRRGNSLYDLNGRKF